MTSCPHCGCDIGHKPRSEADHRRFFALIGAAFAQWPEAHEFQPSSSEHLRSWLLCKAGHHEVITIPVEYAEDQPAMLRLVTLTVEAAMKAADGYTFVRPHGSAIAVFKARSIAWHKLGQKDFGAIRSAVEDVIEAEIGVPADKLLKDHERAA